MGYLQSDLSDILSRNERLKEIVLLTQENNFNKV